MISEETKSSIARAKEIYEQRLRIELEADRTELTVWIDTAFNDGLVISRKRIEC